MINCLNIISHQMTSYGGKQYVSGRLLYSWDSRLRSCDRTLTVFKNHRVHTGSLIKGKRKWSTWLARRIPWSRNFGIVSDFHLKLHMSDRSPAPSAFILFLLASSNAGSARSCCCVGNERNLPFARYCEKMQYQRCLVELLEGCPKEVKVSQIIRTWNS